MAESSLSFDYTRLRRRIGDMLGYGLDPTLWTGDRADEATEVDDFIRDGLTRFYAAHDWSFLKASLEIPLYASYSTGTITVVAGAVTGAGTTFPSWAADGELVTDIGREVATRSSGTALTLTDTSYDASALTTYTLYQAGYTLPDNFGRFIGDTLKRRAGDTAACRDVKIVSIERIRELRWSDTSGDDVMYAGVEWRSTSTTSSAGQRLRVAFWPYSNTAGKLIGRYRLNPDMLDGTNKYPYGGMLHGRTIALACLAEAESMNEHANGAYEARFEKALEDSVRRDRELSPPSIGMWGGAESNYVDDYRMDGYSPSVGAGEPA